ncbi:MAG: TAXI family TRAP transporter solute-binding subunit [Deltaproteobacteria bacterium]|nr:MAG: TAXI family TRAP transporter solute-binding subunit [Deltaproteobacteria bacterium]
MKHLKVIISGFFFAIIAMAMMLMPGEGRAASKKLLAMGSTQSSSSHYAYFVAVAKVINTKVPDVSISVVETGASVDNINRIKKGDLDLGMTTVHLQYQAYHGMGPWKDKPIKDQYVMWVYQPAPQNFVVREDSGVKSVYDLAGKPFNPGIRGSATEKTVEAILDALAIVPEFYRGGTEDTVAGIKDKRFDTSYGLPKAEGVKRITPNYSHNPQLKEATP